MTTHDAFHGRTLATMSASGKASFEALFEPKIQGFRKVPFGDLAAMEAALGSDVVAVMLEPIQGEAGVIVPPAGYLTALRQLTARRGILLICDEVQTGVGRTGALLASEGVCPDIVTLGKGLGAGVPVSAMLCGSALNCFAPGDQGGTHTGHPLLSAVALAVLEVVQTPAFLAGVSERGAALKSVLEQLCQRHDGREVRGRGLLWALDFGRPIAARIVEQARAAGLLLNAPRAECLRFMPALDVELDSIARMAEILDGLI